MARHIVCGKLFTGLGDGAALLGRAHITQNWEVNTTAYGRVSLGLESYNPLL